MNEFIIEDAGTFYTTIKGNPLYEGTDDAEVLRVLEDQWLARQKAAEADGRTETNLTKYMFFQGMFAGCLIAWKQAKHHYETLAFRDGIDPTTGRKIKEA